MKAYQFGQKWKKRIAHCIYVPYMNFVVGFKDYRRRKGVIVPDPVTIKYARTFAKSENEFDITPDQLSAMKYVAGAVNPVTCMLEVRLDQDFDMSKESLLGVLTGEHLQERLVRKIWRTINGIPKKFNYDTRKSDLYKI
ncbi:MAG: hypothetical protein AABW88_04480 [Nanoarchaeota archaeon]